jgi:PAS domain S-box-containing protein
MSILQEAGISAAACDSLPALIRELDRGAGFVLVTEEALATADLAPLSGWLADQQEWSDMPFVLLTSHGGGVERNPAARRYLEVLGNVTFLERPFHPTTMVSLAQSALRGRRRQYEARGRLEALRASEERNSALLSQASAGIAVVDGTGRFTYVNARYCEIVGRSPEDLLSTTMQALTHPDDHGRNLPLFAAAVKGGPAFEIEKRYLLPDGRVVWVRNSVASIRDAEGAFQSILAVSIDISDRKAAEEALRNTEAALRKLNETLEARVEERTTELNRLWHLSEDMLARADYRGMMSAVSPAWTRVLGWSEAELLARPYADIIHPEDIAPTLEALARMGESGEPTRFENRIETAAGGWKPIEWTVAPEPGGLHFIAVGRDLTDVRERDAMLRTAQEALRQSQKMEAMGQLTGGVAHDFNNLLTPIIGSLDRLLTRGVGTERERQLMAGALESADRAKTLVQRLLAFARRQPLQATAVDLSQLIHAMADLMGSTLGPKIEVRVELAPELPPVRADANQLEMALLNLAVNARDVMPDGGSLIISASPETVRSRRSTLKAGHYVRLAVTDTGSGMDEETLGRAIEPFFSTKGIGKGTGLGLSMVHGLAAQLGGELIIRSRLGQGTSVELWLPVSTEPMAEVTAAATSRPARMTRGRALLVDDEDLVRMSTADMLSDLGFEVIEAGSAEEALTLLRSGATVEILVTDHLMPGMSGAQLAREIQAIAPGLPVLIVSGYAEMDGLPSDLPRLVKPFRVGELLERIAALVADLDTAADA